MKKTKKQVKMGGDERTNNDNKSFLDSHGEVKSQLQEGGGEDLALDYKKAQ